MATPNPTERPTTGIHDIEMVRTADQSGETCAAVVFNDAASLADLIAYAKGQAAIANEFLDTMIGGETSRFAFALQGLLEPAMAAMDVAMRKIAMEGRH